MSNKGHRVCAMRSGHDKQAYLPVFVNVIKQDYGDDKSLDIKIKETIMDKNQEDYEPNKNHISHSDLDDKSSDIDQNTTCCVELKDLDAPKFEHGTIEIDFEKEYNLDDVDFEEETWFSKIVGCIEVSIASFYSKNKTTIKLVVFGIILSLYMTYFTYCMSYRFGDEGSVVLLVVTIFILIKIMFKFLDHKGIHIGCPLSFHTFLASAKGRRLRNTVRKASYLIATAAIITYLSLGVFPNNTQNVQSFGGMFLLLFCCFLMSSTPSKVKWYPVFWSMAIQFAVATLTLRTQTGYEIFKWLGDLVTAVIAFSDAGSRLIITPDFKEGGLSISSTGIIIFTNALVFLLNQWGVIEFIVLKLGRFLAFCLETGPVESVVAAANIFIGLAEAPLMVRPYLPTVTKSELHTIMTCGYASISGGVMILFINFGAPANHLLTAAVISAPASLAISKLMYPETEKISLQSQKNVALRNSGEESNSMSAFSEGAVLALSVAASIWANMLAFVSMMDLLDNLSIWLGERAGVEGMDFGVICSYLLFPLSFAMGVHLEDCRSIGKLIGVKLVATPFVAYDILGDLIDNRLALEDYMTTPNNTWHFKGDDIILDSTNTTLYGGILLKRTEVIASYAMCGLSAFAAIGISLGALIPLCPPRKMDIVRLVFRAFIAGNVACFMTGTVAGILYDPRRDAN